MYDESKQEVGGVNQGNSSVEGCVLKEEIVFVWLELVQKASPNSKCSRKNNLSCTMNLG